MNDVAVQAESQTVSWRLVVPGDVNDGGVMRIYSVQRDYVGLAPLVMVRNTRQSPPLFATRQGSHVLRVLDEETLAADAMSNDLLAQ